MLCKNALKGGNVKVLVHVQITRVTSIYHSYFLYNNFWGKPIYKFPGEYSLNVSNQLEYNTSACCFLKLFFLFQIKCFCFFNLYVFSVLFSMLNWCLWCHFGHFHIENICYQRRHSRLIRTEWRHSLTIRR